MLSFAFIFIELAVTRWNRFPGIHSLANVITGINFTDGISDQDAPPFEKVVAA